MLDYSFNGTELIRFNFGNEHGLWYETYDLEGGETNPIWSHDDQWHIWACPHHFPF
jgi:hypothetical protein